MLNVQILEYIDWLKSGSQDHPGVGDEAVSIGTIWTESGYKM